VDPSLAVPEPPKNAKFYSAANSLASNPTKTVPSDMPQIDGRQDKVIKTTDPSITKPQPLQPTPPVQEKVEVAPAKPLEPSPPVPKKIEIAEAKPLPAKSYVPGDLAMAKPREKAVENTNTVETPNADSVQPQPTHTRPRTLAEARQRQGMQGEKMRQVGGVPHISLDGRSSLDVQATAWGDYDRDFIDAVQTCWWQLLDSQQTSVAGKVVVEFKLHADGRITDLRMTASDVSEILGLICQEAIQKPSPFKPWPQKMRQELTDPREVHFTFYYINE
jgi:outer membrane biosynthesis protein TonB